MSNIIIRVILFLLIAVSVFDPSDLVFHLKVPLFVAVWVFFAIDTAISSDRWHNVSSHLYLYLLLFVVILPSLGIMIYILRGGGLEGYDGFQYLKSYLFLTLCIPLTAKRIDLIRPLTLILCLLSIATIVLYAVTLDNDILRVYAAEIGDAYTVFSLTNRSYGALSYQSLYFHASPLLVIPIAYFCYRFLHTAGWNRFSCGMLLALNLCAMLLSGTRNNMFVAVAAPLLIVAWYRGRAATWTIAAFLLVILFIGLSSGVVQAMFDSDDYSTAIKLGHIQDYGMIFSDWKTVLFGQGLGAKFFSTAWGTDVSITELTYLELIRNYGIFVALIFYFLIVYPLKSLINPRMHSIHYLLLGYLSYLYICTANPLLLSSSGMLVLSSVLYHTFSGEATQLSRVGEVGSAALYRRSTANFVT